MSANSSQEILERLRNLNNFLNAHIRQTRIDLEKMEDQRYHFRFLKFTASFTGPSETSVMARNWKQHLN